MAFAAVDVALYVGGGARKADLVHWQKTLAGSEQITLTHLYAADIRTNENAFANVDLLVLPNGDADAQYAALKEDGRTNLVTYITSGGRVLATGAGCELLLTGTRRLGLLPYRCKEGQSGRGRGYTQIKFTADAQKALGVSEVYDDTWFDNGPVLEEVSSAVNLNLQPQPVSAVFATVSGSVMENGKFKKGMANTPAVLCATNATSKILAMTIEPQHFKTTRTEVVAKAIEFLTGEAVTLPDYDLPTFSGSTDKTAVIEAMAKMGTTYVEPTAPDPSRLPVAFYCDAGSQGANNVLWATALNKSPDVQLYLMTGPEIVAGNLAKVQVLVMPGGDSKKQYTSLMASGDGAAKIREFVSGGGKYYGTCAGTSLLLNANNRVKMIPYNRYTEDPSRGGGMVKCEFTESETAHICSEQNMHRPLSMAYHKGPVLKAAPGEGLATMEVLATCGSEVAQFNESKQHMYGTPAILRGTYGSGKLFLTNCHPESYAETRHVISAGFEDLTGRYIRIPDFGPYAYYAGTSKEELVEEAK